MEDVAVCYCVHCNYFSLWNKGKMVYPDFAGIEPPNEDLNNDIKMIMKRQDLFAKIA